MNMKYDDMPKEEVECPECYETIGHISYEVYHGNHVLRDTLVKSLEDDHFRQGCLSAPRVRDELISLRAHIQYQSGEIEKWREQYLKLKHEYERDVHGTPMGDDYRITDGVVVGSSAA